jgi:NAD(P)-dependent dehydrogenase (short-subunit alcohol dehydrogenase family)
MTLLTGKVVVITGAARARGIGKATATLCLEHGARVALLDLDAGEARQAADELGDAALGLGCDVTSQPACQAAVDQVLGWAGRIDVLINNAGLTQKRRLEAISPADYDLVADVVLRGTLYMSQAVIPSLRSAGGGSIINISSMSGQQGGGVFGGAHYCAAKAGVLGLTKAMAKELGPENIRANAIAPGLILTDFSRSGSTDESKHQTAQAWPLRRAGHPSEVAGACLFLASDLSSFMTGATLDVNGGAHLH